ncbi:hypothetical protein FP435_04760 [Lactobacillus sp. PV037]|uniref:hypothetical protein n=1 Tax=Lactobacillus sp. PV037 TaxID=2594496 RepID=UPI00223FE0E0|nr:hypothetical protein [Lactobacillus sp. PV037]QNQ83802.1 hypothetical protein FP435_04760 [Lactobacillus sp. PV037]
MSSKDLSYKELFELSHKVYQDRLDKSESKSRVLEKQMAVRDELEELSDENEKYYARANKATVLISSFIGGCFLGVAYLIGIVVGRGGF